MNCRICESPEVHEIGKVEYYSGFAWDVYECFGCRCRFTKHVDDIYEYLHSERGSRYGGYRELQDECKRAFKNGDQAGFRKLLSHHPKYEFVIQALERMPTTSRVLEVGCSRGYLTAYFALAGYKVTGMDVSVQAVSDAREAFGDFFVTCDSPAVEAGGPYDVIYHTGMIGCVGDPVELTRRLLKLLKPGGQLIFNAPNADSCWLPGQLWIDYAPPPDVVTLFRAGFWQRFFRDSAEVLERVEELPADSSYVIRLQKLFRRKWRAPVPRPLDGTPKDTKRVPRRLTERVGNRVWNLFERSAVKVGRLTRIERLSPREPSPFGLFVTMTRK